MRGTPRIPRPVERGTGIIPAYAGNTSQCAALRAVLRDHPRVCGEHMSATSLAVRLTGSSPRMRGTPNRYRIVFATPGIIPAYAGNTRGLRMMLSRVRDHPRVCGEHGLAATARWGRTESSPRMRGTLRQSIFFVPPHGIIPAYAGNTCSRR